MCSKLFTVPLNTQFISITQACLTFCDPMNYSTPGLPVHYQLLESTQTMPIESVIPSNHLILCRPLLLLPSIFPSIRVFSYESALRIRWPSIGVSKYQNLMFMTYFKINIAGQIVKTFHLLPHNLPQKVDGEVEWKKIWKSTY